jgi:hypothetical protein
MDWIFQVVQLPFSIGAEINAANNYISLAREKEQNEKQKQAQRKIQSQRTKLNKKTSSATAMLSKAMASLAGTSFTVH